MEKNFKNKKFAHPKQMREFVILPITFLKKMARLARIERATFRLGGERSIPWATGANTLSILHCKMRFVNDLKRLCPQETKPYISISPKRRVALL